MPVTTTKHRRATLRRTLVAAALIGSFLTMGGLRVAVAADDDDDTFDTKFVRGILTGLGLKREGDPGINYHERSPLVVPPTRELPPPTDSATAATRDPAWPKDPDVTRRKKIKREIRNTGSAEEEDMRQLRPDEMRGTRSGIGRTATAGSTAPGAGVAPEQLTPSQLGFTGFGWNALFNRDGKVVPFVQEPARTTLTEPPPGLRTPSPKYQYGSKGGLEPTRENAADQAVGSTQ